LDPPKDSEPGKVQVSRRSWERLGDAIAHAGLIDVPADPAFYSISMGYVGVEAAIRFTEYAKTVDNRFTGADVVNKYKSVRSKILKKNQAEVLNTAIEKASEYVAKLDNITDVQGENLMAFMNDLSGELRVSLWTKLTSTGIDKLDLARSIHKHLAESILDVFGVKKGEAGINMMPNIPDVFKNQAKK
jgi:hypothetical protein